MRNAARRWMVAVSAVTLVAAACSSGESEGASREGTAASTTSAAASEGPAADPEPEPIVSAAALNVLHGIFCVEASGFCSGEERLGVVWAEIEDLGCPDLVGLQEIGPLQSLLVPATLDELCGGRYELLWDPEAQGQNLDQEMILSSLPVLDDAYFDLALFPWGAHWARVETASGEVVDFVTSHYASGANNPRCGDVESGEVCPAICDPELEAALCHPVQTLAFLDSLDPAADLEIVSGDLNATVDEQRIRILTDEGFIDTWLDAGNPECDPVTGDACTSGMDDEDPTVFQRVDPGSVRDERIDFVLARTRPECGLVTIAAAPFADSPRAEPIGTTYWASDHGGVAAELALDCG